MLEFSCSRLAAFGCVFCVIVSPGSGDDRNAATYELGKDGALSKVEALALEIEMLEASLSLKEDLIRRQQKQLSEHKISSRGVRNAERPVSRRLKAYVQDVLKPQPGSTLIFTAATKGFIRGVVNWLALLHRLEVTNVFIFAMDNETHAWFNSRGLRTYQYMPHDAEYVNDLPNRGGMGVAKGNNKYRRMLVWYERSRLIRDLLKMGHTVIQSDGDALWLQNPIYELESLPPKIDVAFSRGNARAGKAGRGTGVCMGFVMYRPQPGAIEFVQALLDRMREVYDVDQGIANAFIGGPRGSNRDTDKVNPELWSGTYKGTTWVQLPQTRYARHAGNKLLAVADRVDLHVFHPADEGWSVPFRFLPQILPTNFSMRPTNGSKEVKQICQSGRWFERMGYSARDQRILECCGLWLMRDGWDNAEFLSEDTFATWLRRVSYISISQQYKLQHPKRAFKEPD